jgi:branched-chain amino acid transport system ATP-binding protein
VQAFSAMIREFRDEGRAVLLVDHNVRSVAALVDRALAMYLGERIAEGTAEEVMRDETVRRVYMGEALTRAARTEAKSADTRPLLEVENVEVRYGKALALQGVSLAVREGEFVSVVGLNGAGKSTLFNAISRMVPHTGTIRWGGEPLAGLTAAQVARSGIVQCPETRELFGDMTVRENLDLGAYRRGRARRQQSSDRVFAIFPRLAERQRQRAGTLSGGEQQMLAIGRGLMAEPKLLILDEPSLGLSPLLVEELFALINSIHAQGIAILLVEQNVVQSLEVASRAYILDNGVFVLQGSAAEIRDNPDLKRAYLGM